MTANEQPHNQKSVEQLITELQDPDWEVRRNAAIILGRSGDKKAIQPLVVALSDDDEGVTDGATHALACLGVDSFTPLLDELQSGSHGGRGNAARTLGLLDDKRAVAPLMAVLDDENLFVVASAIGALGRLQDAKAFEPFVHFLRSENLGNRQSAIIALGDLHDERAIDLLLPLVNDHDLAIQISAVIALTNFDRPDVLQALIAVRQNYETKERGFPQILDRAIAEIEARQRIQP